MHRVRRDHFAAETDIWEVFLRVAAGRKEREINPAVAALRGCVIEAEHDPAVPRVAAQRLEEMLRFVEMMEGWYAQMLSVPKSRLSALIRLGSKVLAFLPQDKTGRRQPT